MTDITLGRIETSSGALLHRAAARLRLWSNRRRSRDELARLSARDLHDIGISQAQASYEVGKRFWQP